MNKKRKEIILTLVFLGILLLVGLNSGLYSLRIDATENKMFSLHPASRNLFRDIPEQVHLTYYLTEKLKTTNAVYRQVEDILREYAANSGGKVKLGIFDPVRDNKLQEVEEHGIRQFDTGRQKAEDEASFISNASSGIVIQYLDRVRVLDLVQSVDTLEYDISTNIRNLVTDRTNKVGYLVDAEEFNFEEFSNILSALRRSFDVEEIRKGEDIPSSFNALFVIGGQNLSEFELYPIDQYIMRGGRVIFAVDAVRIVMQPPNTIIGIPADQAPLLTMLKAYGAGILPELVLEHQDLALAVGRDVYHYYFNSFQDFVSKDNPITNRMRPVYFFWASPLGLAPETMGASAGPVKAETLISSSPYATIAKNEFKLNPQEARLMYQVLASQQKSSVPLVAALSGSFTSYFKDKEIPKKDGVQKEWTKTESLSSPTRLIVSGDADLFSPVYINRGAESNFSFLVNCLNWLSNDEDLLAIRTRAQQDVLMGKIQDPQARQAATTVVIIINLIAMPLLVIGFGILNYFLRRKKQKV